KSGRDLLTLQWHLGGLPAKVMLFPHEQVGVVLPLPHNTGTQILPVVGKGHFQLVPGTPVKGTPMTHVEESVHPINPDGHCKWENDLEEVDGSPNETESDQYRHQRL